MENRINIERIRNELGVPASFVIVHMLTSGDTKPSVISQHIPYSTRTVQRVFRFLENQELITKMARTINLTDKFYDSYSQ